jgi:hypothetical protein
MRQPLTPEKFAKAIDGVLEEERAAYRVVDGDTFMPVCSDTERETLERAFHDVSAKEFQGARAHLKNAAIALGEGKYADSVRESIHAVESVARVLVPSAKLQDSLTQLEKSAAIHGAMKSGFLALYGFSSDEQGIRHPLLSDGDANVSDADALFMIGACASFVSYLLNRARRAGMLTTRAGEQAHSH